MAVTYISDLTAAADLDGTEVFPGDQGVNTRKITANQLRKYINFSNNVFNILDYGAVMDSTTDNAASIQAAIDDAIVYKGTVLVPNTSIAGVFDFYRINSGLTIIGDVSYPENQIHICMHGEGHISRQIKYFGANNGSVLTITGMKGGHIDNIKLTINDGITGTTCFDIGTNTYASSTGGFSFTDCAASLGNGVNNRGWRIGAVSAGGNEDISNISWNNCNVWGGTPLGYSGQTGWLITGSNCLEFTWTGGGSAFCDKSVHVTGGGSCYFFGFGGSNNTYDFNIEYANNCGIYGGRFESSKKFLYIPPTDNHHSIVISDCQLGNYIPDDGYVFQTYSPGTIIMEGVTLNDELHTTPVVHLGTASTKFGYFSWKGGYEQSTSTDLVTITTPAQWKVDIRGVGKMNSSFLVTGYFADVVV